ncbi:major facilitator superfamily domain-containing protein [Cladorrhinum samala]|uniref:Major facilitator superfamily domain-containing protein n=1 Tax=Cladorrhinum samala TaxID=585594 RepID=A0AAV9HLN5_9PEZI|nr:major facilitator superfamily domain-containing protein [Cladorrhinum samala]
MGTVFSLSATIFQQPIAELSHVLGRKPAFLLVLAVFALGSIVAGTANNMAVLLLGRGMQGFASGGSVLAAIVLSDLIAVKDRATWIAYQNATQALGLRWLFYVNLPAIAISGTGLWYFLGFDRPQGTMAENLLKADWLGITIFIPSAVAFLSPLTMAGVLYEWKSCKALVPLLTGLLGLVVLAAHQRFWARHPMFRAVVFEEPAVVCALFGLTVFGLCVNMIFYYLVVFWSGVKGLNEILTGVALLPETLTIPIAAILCGAYMRLSNQIHWAMRFGWPLSTLSLGLLWFLDDKTPLWGLIVINIGVGFGAGMVSPALHLTILAATEKKINGHATAMAYLFKSAGMCLGVALGTAVFTMQMTAHFNGVEAGQKMNAESMLQMLKEVKSDPNSMDAIIQTLRILWMLCCALSGVAGTLCNLCKYPPVAGDPSIAAAMTESNVLAEKDSPKPSTHLTSFGDSCFRGSSSTSIKPSVDLPQQAQRRSSS